MADRSTATTVSLVKSFWPDFPISVQLMKQPTCEFVVDFFSRFIKEVQEKISFFIGDDVNLVNDKRDFDYTVFLCGAISEIMKKLKCGSDVTLNDFYNPNPKKTAILLRVAIHFIIFSANNMDELSAIHNRGFQQYRDQLELESKVKELSEEVNSNTIKLGRSAEHKDKLLRVFEQTKAKYDKMSEERKTSEKEYAMKNKEMARMTTVTQNLHLKIQQSLKEEAKLSEQVISDEDFKNLKDLYQVQVNEMEQLSIVDSATESALREQTRLLDHFKEIVRGLDVSVNSVLVKEWQKGEAMLIKRETEMEKLRAGSALLSDDVGRKEKEISALRETLAKSKSQLVKTQITLDEQLEGLEKTHKLKSADHFNKIALYKNSEKVLRQIKEEIANLNDQLEKLEKVSDCEFKKMTNVENKVVNNFINILVDQLNKCTIVMEEVNNCKKM